jgi:hypothetical protein
MLRHDFSTVRRRPGAKVYQQSREHGGKKDRANLSRMLYDSSGESA